MTPVSKVINTRNIESVRLSLLCFWRIHRIQECNLDVPCLAVSGNSLEHFIRYCRTHNLRVCSYIAYIACGSSSLYIKTLYFLLTVLAMSAAATVTNIKVRYGAKTPQFAIFGTCVICVFYSISSGPKLYEDGYMQ